MQFAVGACASMHCCLLKSMDLLIGRNGNGGAPAFHLKHTPRPKANAFHAVYCT